MIKPWLTSPKDKSKLGEIWLWVSLAGISTGGAFSISLYWLINGGGIIFLNILLLKELVYVRKG